MVADGVELLHGGGQIPLAVVDLSLFGAGFGSDFAERVRGVRGGGRRSGSSSWLGIFGGWGVSFWKTFLSGSNRFAISSDPVKRERIALIGRKIHLWTCVIVNLACSVICFYFPKWVTARDSLNLVWLISLGLLGYWGTWKELSKSFKLIFWVSRVLMISGSAIRIWELAISSIKIAGGG